MKKLLFGIFLFFTACSKENIEWIKPWHQYNMPQFYLINNTGAIPIIKDLFPMATNVSFVKNHTGFKGDGKIIVTRTNTKPQTYSGYKSVYDEQCNCYYYEWQEYVINLSTQETSVYKFDWDWVKQNQIRITFAEYSFNNKALEEKSFLKLLDGVYTVTEITKNQDTGEAEIISMTKTDNTFRMVLVY